MSFFKNIFSNSNTEGENNDQRGLNWKILQTEEELAALTAASSEKPVVIFKHSTSCSISAMAKNRMERSWQVPEDKADVYYLDLIAHRNVSNKIAEDFGVIHASPQVLVIKNGEAIYDNSHYGIDATAISKIIG